MTDYVTAQKADTMAAAIAKAEGFPVLGSLPNRCHNPGDLKLGDRGWGIEDGKTIFLKADFGAPLDDKSDGASALRRQCLAMLCGASHEYSINDSLLTVAYRWTGRDNALAWAQIVGQALGINSNTTLRRYLLDSEEA